MSPSDTAVEDKQVSEDLYSPSTVDVTENVPQISYLQQKTYEQKSLAENLSENNEISEHLHTPLKSELSVSTKNVVSEIPPESLKEPCSQSSVVSARSRIKRPAEGSLKAKPRSQSFGFIPRSEKTEMLARKSSLSASKPVISKASLPVKGTVSKVNISGPPSGKESIPIIARKQSADSKPFMSKIQSTPQSSKSFKPVEGLLRKTSLKNSSSGASDSKAPSPKKSVVKPYGRHNFTQLSLVEIFSKNLYKEVANKINLNTGILGSLESAINCSLLDPSKGTVKNLRSQKFLPVNYAIRSGLLDIKANLLVLDSKSKMTLGEAYKQGAFSENGPPPDQTHPLAIQTHFERNSPAQKRVTPLDKGHPICHPVTESEQSHAHTKSINWSQVLDMGTDGQLDAAKHGNELLEELDKEHHWIVGIENRLVEQGSLSLESESNRTLVEEHQDIHSEIFTRQQPVISLCYQGEQLIDKHANNLVKEVADLLKKKVPETRHRLDEVKTEADSRIRLLTSSLDCLDQVMDRVEDIKAWQDSSDSALKTTGNLAADQLQEEICRIKSVEGEIYTHQADIKALSAAGHKFISSAMNYETCQTAFNQSHGQEPTIPPPSNALEQWTRDTVKSLTDRHTDLLDRCRERLSLVGEASSLERSFTEKIEHVEKTLDNAANSLEKWRANPEPATRNSADLMQSLRSELAATHVAIESLSDTAADLKQCLDSCGANKDTVRQAVHKRLLTAASKHKKLLDEVATVSDEAEMKLLNSQDLPVILEGLVHWLDGSEKRLESLSIVSLSATNLEDQIRALMMLNADLEGRRPGVKAITKMADKTEDSARLETLIKRFNDLSERVNNQQLKLSNVQDKLNRYYRNVRQLGDWSNKTADQLGAKTFNRLDDERFADKVSEIKIQKEGREEDLQRSEAVMKEFLAMDHIVDEECVTIALEELQRSWQALNDVLNRRTKEIANRKEHGKIYNQAKSEFFEWLSQMEASVNTLPAVAVEVTVMQQQLSQVIQLIDTYDQAQEKVGHLTTLGYVYDSVLQGISPEQALLNKNTESTTSPQRKTRARRSARDQFSQRSKLRLAASPSPMSPQSSSESSGVSSADNMFACQEISEVNQELDDITDRYNLVGDRLSDRKADLDSMLVKVNEFQSQLVKVVGWLDEKVTASLANQSSLPLTVEEAQLKLEETKNFHSDLLNLGPAIEDLRDKEADLLRNREYVAGVTEMKERLGQVEKKWNTLKEMSVSYQQNVEEIKQNLQTFNEIKKNLDLWIGQKRRMMSVLGPLVTSPPVATNQLQQIQVLQDDIDSLAPDVQRLENTAKLLLDKLPAKIPETVAIENGVENVHKQLAELRKLLDERKGALEKLIGPSADFYSVINKLNDAITPLHDRVDGIDLCSAQKQLEEISDCQLELSNCKKELQNASEICRNLCQTMTDPAIQFDLKNKVSNLERSLRDMQQKLDSKRSDIDRSTHTNDRFEAQLKQLVDWVAVKKRDAQSGKLITLKKPHDQEKAVLSLLSDIRLHQNELENLKRVGGDILSNAESTPRAQQINTTLHQVGEDLAYLEEFVSKQTRSIKDASEKSADLLDRINRLKTWLELEDGKLQLDGSLPVERADLMRAVSEICQAIRELEGKETELNQIRSRISQLSSSDASSIKPQVENLTKTLSSLLENSKNRQSNLQTLLNRVNNLYDNLHDTSSNIGRLEERWTTLSKQHRAATAGSTDVPGKLTERTSNLLEEAESLKPTVAELNQEFNQLKSELKHFGEKDPQKTCRKYAENIEQCEQKLTKLLSGLSLLLDQLKAGDEIVDKFKNRIRIVSQRQNGLSSQLDTMPQSALDADSLSDQMDDLNHIENQIDECKDSVESFRSETANLVEQGYVQAAGKLEERVDKLADQNKRLVQRVEDIKINTQKRLTEVNDFVEQLGDVNTRLADTLTNSILDIEPREENEVNGDLSDSELNSLREFCKSTIEPMKSSVDRLNNAGQSLLRSVPPGISARKVEHDLEKANQKMSDLIERVSLKEQSADTSILQAGKFEETCNILNEFLAGMQETLTAEGSPSSEYHIAKSQLNSHGLLTKMLKDRQPSLESLNQAGNKLMTAQDSKVRADIHGKLTKLNNDFSKCQSTANSKMNNFEQGVRLAKKFRDRYEPILAWLDGAEKKLSSMDHLEGNPEPSVIQQHIDQYKKLNKDIIQHKQAILDLNKAGQELIKCSTPSDATQIEQKMSDIDQYYTVLRNKSFAKQKQLEEALPLSQRFSTAHNKLDQRLTPVETSLKAVHKTPEAERQSVERIERDLNTLKPIVKSLQTDAARLRELLPSEASDRVTDILEADMNRYDFLTEEVARRAARLGTSVTRGREACEKLDECREWLEEEITRVKSLEALPANVDKLKERKQDLNSIDENWTSKKAEITQLLQDSRKIMREAPSRDQNPLKKREELVRNKISELDRSLRETIGRVDQALPLAVEFSNSENILSDWLVKAEKEIGKVNLLKYTPEELKTMQQENKLPYEQARLQQELDDYKPTVDKINKTVVPLAQLLTPKDADFTREIAQDINTRYNKLKKFVKGRLYDLEDIMNQTFEFTEQLDNLKEALATVEDQLTHGESVSAQIDKLRSQSADARLLEEELEQRLATLQGVQKGALDMIRNALTPEEKQEATAVLDKAEALMDQWRQLKSALNQRHSELLNALNAADTFWNSLDLCNAQLDALKERLDRETPPSADLDDLSRQQKEMQLIESDADNVCSMIEHCCDSGDDLLATSDEKEHPEIKRALEELNRSWKQLKKRCEDRQTVLQDHLTKATEFQLELEKILGWIKTSEGQFDAMGPIATHTEGVIDQLEEIKAFKYGLEPRHAEVEGLNQMGYELTKNCLESSKVKTNDAVEDVNRRWDNLMDCVNDRDHKLQTTLLSLGEFNQALNELLSWIDKTDQNLDDILVIHGDPKGIEIEMAKHKMINSDIAGHAASIDKVAESAQNRLSQDPDTSDRLENMNSGWKKLLEKSKMKQMELDEALKDALIYYGELHDMLNHLADVENLLLDSKPLGGLPDSAKDQLNKFEDIFATFDDLEKQIHRLQDEGENLIDGTSESGRYRLKNDLTTLQDRWNSIKERSKLQKVKLEETFSQVQDFHTALSSFISWLTLQERVLNQLKPVGRLVSTVNEQIDYHRALKTEISSKREEIKRLERLGTQLKYTSQKQDVILIKNLLASVHHRWDRICSRGSERTRHLDIGYKESKKFLDMWTVLMEWLRDQLPVLEDEATIGNDADTIRLQIARHKEFQCLLGAQNSSYDATRRFGKIVCDHAPNFDLEELERMLHDLKTLWQSICNKSVDRQRALEEALLYSGQYKDALAALLDWLYKIEPTLLSSQDNCFGDVDTVQTLLESHKSLLKELENRRRSADLVRKSAKELMAMSQEDSSAIQNQLVDLSSLWERMEKLAEEKSKKLEEANRMATEFSKTCRSLMDYFAGVEHTLRQMGALPEDEEDTSLERMIGDHTTFHRDLEDQKPRLEACLQLGHEILTRAHADAMPSLKQWMNILRSRWDELTDWSEQRGHKLQESLVALRERRELLSELLGWLTGAEATLKASNDQPLPEDREDLCRLLDEHEDFESEINKRQVECDSIINNSRRRYDVEDHSGTRSQSAGTRTPRGGGPTGIRTPRGHSGSVRAKRRTESVETSEPQFCNHRVTNLHSKWKHVNNFSADRRKKIEDAIEFVDEMEKMKTWEFDDWRQRYLQWMNQNKARVMDFFHRKDLDHDGKVTRQEFIDGILESNYVKGKCEKFQTSRIEMEAVADIFDSDRDGYIDYKEFLAALRPDGHIARNLGEQDHIQNELKRQAKLCKCSHTFTINKIGDGKFTFGNSQKLRLVRVLRSTVMVRVGGGWVTLEEFLSKNDPCRAKGRLNTDILDSLPSELGVGTLSKFRCKSPHLKKTNKTAEGDSASPCRKSGATTPASLSTSRPGSSLAQELNQSQNSNKSQSRTASSTKSRSSPSPATKRSTKITDKSEKPAPQPQAAASHNEEDVASSAPGPVSEEDAAKESENDP